MSKLSVPEAAERLGVSPARVRQRIDEGSLVAEKIGGRWLVDLDASQSAPSPKGRPVSPSSVWWSLASAEVAKAAVPNALSAAAMSNLQKSLKPAVDAALLRKLAMPAVDVGVFKKLAVPAFDSNALIKSAMPSFDVLDLRESLLPRMRLAERLLAEHAAAADDPDGGRAGAVDELDVLAPGFLDEAMSLSRSSRSRAIHRFVEAVVARDYPALLGWLSNRGSRKLYVAAGPDLGAVRADARLLLSGVSHADSGLEDPRMVEAYVSDSDLDGVVNDYWLERPVVDERPNVVLHVVPVRPPEVGRMLLAADLAEHGGPREVQRAHELLEEAIEVLIADHANPAPPEGQELA